MKHFLYIVFCIYCKIEIKLFLGIKKIDVKGIENIQMDFSLLMFHENLQSNENFRTKCFVEALNSTEQIASIWS